MSKRGRKDRRNFTAEQKATMLRRHLVDKVAVSDLCDEYGIQPSLFYNWQRVLLANARAALGDGRTRRGQKVTASRDQERIEALEAKLAKKDAVIAEISEEYVELKKSLGES